MNKKKKKADRYLDRSIAMIAAFFFVVFFFFFLTEYYTLLLPRKFAWKNKSVKLVVFVVSLFQVSWQF